jgi:short-subunit dehydrogenase
LAAELDRSGVTVTALCPGPVATGFQERAGMKSLRFMHQFAGQSAQEVAFAGWEGFKQHRRIVIPGTFNKLSAYAGRYAPRWFLLPAIKALQAPRH